MRKLIPGLLIIAFCCLFLNGCALLKLPGQVLQIVADIVKGVFDLAKRVPAPPPGVIY